MIKSIPHGGRHQIQTKFGILDRLYPTGDPVSPGTYHLPGTTWPQPSDKTEGF